MCIGRFHEYLESIDETGGHNFFYSHAFSTNEFVVGVTLAAILFFTPLGVAMLNNYGLKCERKRRLEDARYEKERIIIETRKATKQCYCNKCVEIELGLKHPYFVNNRVKSKRQVIQCDQNWGLTEQSQFSKVLYSTSS